MALKGKTVVITGASCGLGLHLAKAAFRDEATVILACRDEVKFSHFQAFIQFLQVRGRRAVEEVLSENPNADQSRVQFYIVGFFLLKFA